MLISRRISVRSRTLHEIAVSYKRKMPHYADTSSYTVEELAFWEWLVINQNSTFWTMRDLEFHIFIRGNELFIDRKKKGLTRATVNIALRKAREIEYIRKSPKELGTFGTSYLMPLFLACGILKSRVTGYRTHDDLFRE